MNGIKPWLPKYGEVAHIGHEKVCELTEFRAFCSYQTEILLRNLSCRYGCRDIGSTQPRSIYAQPHSRFRREPSRFASFS